MLMNDNTLVAVQCAWDAWRMAAVRVGDLQACHWSQPPGAPRALVHAYVSPSKVVSGDLGLPNAPTLPEQVLVCVLKSRNTVPSYMFLAELADGSESSARAELRRE
jgi:hypothetical protein